MRHNNCLKSTNAAYVVAVGLTFTAFTMYMWGLRQNLPYAPEVDEKLFWVERAVMMASTASANPGWFGHPGSTILYPMSMVFRLFYGDWAQKVFETAPSWFYIFGRMLVVFYATMSIPIMFLLGKKYFGEKIGLLGAWFFMCYPLFEFKIVRTDSAAVFWGLLALWRILEVSEASTFRNQVLAGLSIGVSIASRYFMVALIPVLFLVDSLVINRAPLKKAIVIPVGIGLLVIVLTFMVTTPYFFLDFGTTLGSLRTEARTEHVGADGLSHVGNLWWYLTTAIPNIVTWPQYCLAIGGIGWAIWKRQFLILLMAGYTIIFLMAISLSALHWSRWLIPVLPLLALFAAFALYTLCIQIFKAKNFQFFALGLGVVGLSIGPAYQFVLFDFRLSMPSTRVLARNWAASNLPPKSRIAQEWYAALLGNTDFAVTELFSLSENNSMDFYLSNDYDYLIVSDSIYNRYFKEPVRYPKQVEFYVTLFEKGILLCEFKRSDTQGGPTIRIYKLNNSAPP